MRYISTDDAVELIVHILFSLQNLKHKAVPIRGAKKIWRYDYVHGLQLGS